MPALSVAVALGQFYGSIVVGFGEGVLGVQPDGLVQVRNCLRKPFSMDSSAGR